MTRIVIDIPDITYKVIMQGLWLGSPEVEKVIKNGTVLPKGHGDLIDRNDLFTEYPEIAIEPYINAPTVIKADKENGNV